jgi:hypothetical protein
MKSHGPLGENAFCMFLAGNKHCHHRLVVHIRRLEDYYSGKPCTKDSIEATVERTWGIVDERYTIQLSQQT